MQFCPVYGALKIKHTLDLIVNSREAAVREEVSEKCVRVSACVLELVSERAHFEIVREFCTAFEIMQMFLEVFLFCSDF